MIEEEDLHGRLVHPLYALAWSHARLDLGLCRWCGHPLRRQTFIQSGFVTDWGLEICPICDQNDGENFAFTGQEMSVL